METLRAVFPAVPDAALRRVLEMCGGSVEAASEWILEHDWRELERDGGAEQEQRHGGAAAAEGGGEEEAEGANRPQTVVVSAGNMAGELPARERRRDAHGPQRYFARSSMLGARFEDSGGENGGDSEDDDDDGDDEDEDDEDEDEDDDDDDDDDDDPNEFYDSGDDAYMRGMLPPLTKRVKIAQADTDGKTSQPNADAFWVAFDDVVVTKNLIELLNTTLSKLAHSRVVLLNRPARNLDEGTASARLRSVLSKKDPAPAESREATEPARANPTNGRIALSVLLNSSSPPAAISPIESKVSTLSSTSGVGQKRKRVEEDSTPKKRGFFAHFFPVSDLDMIWRSVMHAHLFNSRFGETIEFHTASSGLFHKRDFDELMHLHSHSATTRTASLNLSPFTSLKCCLILPCEADDEEIFRVGKHLHSILKLHGSLYYRTLNDNEGTPATNNANERHNTLSDLLDEDGKMTEDSFRRFARYRIKRDEPAAKDVNTDDGKHPADHFLAYQRQQKVEYCLQVLKTDGWDRQLSS